MHEDEEPPAPPVLSLMDSIQTAITTLDEVIHHRLPLWQYRLLIASLITAVTFLALLLIISCLYGFGLRYPHITVVGSKLVLPDKLVDSQGDVPLQSHVRFDNENIFPVRACRSTVSIYTDAGYRHLLGEAQLPALYLHARERNRTVISDYKIADINNVDGGKEILQSVLKAKPTIFYTRSIIPLQVKGLGFVPITRKYKVECKVLKLWGKKDQGEMDDTVSDCFGRFV